MTVEAPAEQDELYGNRGVVQGKRKRELGDDSSDNIGEKWWRGGAYEGDDENSDGAVEREMDQTAIDELMMLYFSSRKIIELGDEDNISYAVLRFPSPPDPSSVAFIKPLGLQF
ncbi:hypothetical protein ZIOFF_004244 [Zingiber officinale]|uniref:Uncharacterized protein n=1 Tax=Zingiber officinale TaxID=94328 RepID=A0A8J5I7U7_ZINOF|nr:hypothetical protein ZIOFF_004244 [Zingiber officinale]